MKINSGGFRIYFLFFLFFLLSAVIIGRLFSIQVKQHSFYKELADSQHFDEKTLLAERGKIFFSDENTILAENKGTKEVYIAPREIIDIRETSEILSKAFKIDAEEIFKKISDKDDPWIPLKEISAAEGETIKNINGVHFKSTFERSYSQGEIASHIAGFCNKENQGQYGIEQYYQKELRGKDGYRKGIIDAKGKFVLSSFNKIQDPIDGDNFVLTLDFNIQFFIEEKLKEIIEKYKASGGTIIISNPGTGEILAMASQENFDPNEYGKEKDISIFKDPAISIPFEPGSIFKPITMAGALEEGIVSPSTTYIDKGEVKIGSYSIPIRNSDLKAHGKKTMTEVLELSLNTGIVFVQQQLGSEKFTEYVEKFGFDKSSGINLSGEISGNINNILNPLSNEKLLEYANASFGQGVAATPIQIVTAFSAIANQGEMMKPYIVKKIILSDKTEEDIEPEIISKVISPETASRLTAMMVSVVENGYGKKAGVDGYLIAGKTGTAQISEGGRYLPDRTIHSFVGFAPAFNPEFFIFLKIDEPKGIRFSSDSLAPVFKEIAQYLFTYLGILPEEKNSL